MASLPVKLRITTSGSGILSSASGDYARYKIYDMHSAFTDRIGL